MFQMRANIVCVGLFCVTAMLPLDVAKADQVAGHLGTPFTRALRAGRE